MGLDAEHIIIEEYKQSSAFVIQVFDDRSKVFALYVTYITGVAAILSFLFKGQSDSFSDLVREIFPNLWWIAILNALIHMFFFTRLGYLDKKYNGAIQRMNISRRIYREQFGKNLSSGEELFLVERSPRRWWLVHPLFPVTEVYALLASVLFASALYYAHDNWKWNWAGCGVWVGVIAIFFVSILVHIKIAKAEPM